MPRKRLDNFTAVFKALYDFWAGFSSGGSPLPAYCTGHVPHVPGTGTPVSMPYITFEAMHCPPFGAAALTASAWFRTASDYNARLKAADFFDQVTKRLPHQGTRLTCDGGLLILYPNTSSFLAFMDDPEDDGIVRARVGYEAYYFVSDQ